MARRLRIGFGNNAKRLLLESGGFSESALTTSRLLRGWKVAAAAGAFAETGADAILTKAYAGHYRTSANGRLFIDAVASSPSQRINGYMAVAARASVADPKEEYNIGGFNAYGFGPNVTYVDAQAKWPWVNLGGDWIDSTGAAQGSSPHFSFAANSVASGGAAYTASITAGVQAARIRGRWNAYIVMTSASSRSIAAIHHPTLAPPSISVTYTDSTTATLACVACVAMAGGTASTQPGDIESSISASYFTALEFEMPTKAVSSATLNINLSQHTVTSVTVSGFLANPTANSSSVSTGVAAAYPMDAGIGGDASVLFAQRYADGSTLSDFVFPLGTLSVNVNLVDNWDAGLYGGSNDITKLPTAYGGITIVGTNKWFFRQDTSTTVSLVNSSYSGDGFAPFQSGLGALRIVIPGSAAADGADVGNFGSTGSDLWALFPKAISGLVDEVYCRFAVRFAFTPKFITDTKMYRNGPGAVAHYSLPAGKWGIGAHHWTYYGGNNRSGGGNLGWSNRLAYVEAPADVVSGGISTAIHSLDMNPFGTGEDNMPFGKDGGLGASLYPNQWYEIEVRIKLNTYSGTSGSPADGVMQMWVDGKLDSTWTGWRYRDGAIDYVTDTPNTYRFAPYRQLGAIGIALNAYNGGVTPPDHDLVMFIGPNVAGTSYIGPMAVASARTLPAATGAMTLAGIQASLSRSGNFSLLASKGSFTEAGVAAALTYGTTTLPSWVPAPGEIVTLTQANGGLTNKFRDVVHASFAGFYTAKIYLAYSGAIANPYFGTFGSVIFEGGGHAATNDNSVIQLELGASSCTFRRVTTPTLVGDLDNSPSIYSTTTGEYVLDGQPTARHSYGEQNVIGPSDGGATYGTFIRVFNAASAFAGLGSGEIPHKVDFTATTGTMAWERAGTARNVGTSGIGAAPIWSAHVPAQSRIYLEDHSGTFGVRWFDLTTGAYVSGSGTGRTEGAGGDTTDGATLFHVPERSLLVFCDKDSSTGFLRIRTMDVSVSQPSWVNTPRTLSANIPVITRWNAACWCSDNSRILVGHVNGDPNCVYEIEIPTALSSTWTATRVPFTSGQTITWADNPAYGGFGYKVWSYNPKVKAIVYFGYLDQDGSLLEKAFVYRPRNT